MAHDIDDIEPRDIADYKAFVKLKAKGFTYAEIGEKLGYHPNTLGLWRNREDYNTLFLKYSKNELIDKVAKANICVDDNLDTQNLKAAELVFKMAGLLVDKQTVEHSGTVTLSDIQNADKEDNNDKKGNDTGV